MENENNQKHCPKCGKENPNDARYCNACGCILPVRKLDVKVSKAAIVSFVCALVAVGFFVPVFVAAMDFRKLEYMNSSTITPIIKVLDRAKRGKNHITVIYDKTLKWQELSFSAMEIFQTKDKRIEIKGAE